MYRSRYYVSKMDCPSEESLIRAKLAEQKQIRALEFDLSQRVLDVFHWHENASITEALSELALDSKLVDSQTYQGELPLESGNQSQVLRRVLGINLAFFIIELLTGWWAQSMGLIADSLDMLADALVYGLSLWAVGNNSIRKKQTAKVAGYLQITLALLGFGEVLRRFIWTQTLPDIGLMIAVSILALIANGYCLYLLQRSQSRQEAHMQASLIFTSNDVIINLGVIIAGGLSFWLQSRYPDLIIGALVFLIVMRGARRILALAK